MAIVLLLQISLLAIPVTALPQTIKFGAILDSTDDERRLKQIVDIINQDSKILPHSKFSIETPRVAGTNSFYHDRAVCQLLEDGVVGVFGMSSTFASNTKSICHHFNIPYIDIKNSFPDDSSEKQSALYFFPSTSIAQAQFDLIQHSNWVKFAIIYDSSDKLQLLHLFDIGLQPILRILGSPNDFRHTLKEINGLGIRKIVLNCDRAKTEILLTHAQELGMMSPDYAYILATLDLHMLPIIKFQHSGANITAFRLVNTSATGVNKLLEQYFQQNSKSNEHGTATNAISTIFFLLYDAIKLLAKTLHTLDATQQIHVRLLKCNESEVWGYGSAIYNYIQMLPTQGLTGKIDFNNTPYRTNIALDIIAVTPYGIKTIGHWNSSSLQRCHIFKEDVADRAEAQIAKDELIISIPYSEPFLIMKSEDMVTGSQKLEGYAIDLLKVLAEIMNFKYTLNPVVATEISQKNKWESVVEQIYLQRSDIGIGDITITGERSRLVDFVPFMHHGIVAAYVSSKSFVPNWSSLTKPFSTHVWLTVSLAYICVSALLCFTERMGKVKSTKSKTNEVPKTLSQKQYKFRNSCSASSAVACISSRARLFSSSILLQSWSIFVVLMASMYTANLVATLLNNRNNVPISAIKDLPSSVQFGCAQGSTTMKYLQDSGNSLERSIWSSIKGNPKLSLKLNVELGIEEVANSNGNFAFLGESPEIEYQVMRRCGVETIGNPINTLSYGIALPKGSKYIEPLRQAMLQLQEEGFLIELREKWWNLHQQNCDIENSAAKPLHIETFSSIIVFLGVGCILAILIHVCDYMRRRPTKVTVTDGQDLVKDVAFALKRTVVQEATLSEDNIGPFLDLGINSYGFPQIEGRILAESTVHSIALS